MHALITGGAGFIGSHLAEALIEEGHEVSIIDDLSTGRMANIEHLKDKAGLDVTIDTILNQTVLAPLIDRADVVFHLAAAVGVKLIVESPVNTIETNIRGTDIVLKLANEQKKKVVITSTSEVYGKNPKVPFREDSDIVLGRTDKGRWSYACSKAIDEFLAIAYWHEKKLPTIIIRLFNTVGPRQTGQYGMVLPTFVKQALFGHPITVYGDGQQSRCFTYVEDVVQAILHLTEHPNAVGQVVNLGSTEEITIEGLANLIKEMTNSSSEIVRIPYDQAYEEGFEDMKRRIPDLSKAKELIGFEPKIDLRGIIRRVVEFFQQ